MILIDGKPFDASAPGFQYPAGSTERTVLERMASSPSTYRYDTPEELGFELKLRGRIVQAAKDLNNSDFAFEVFRESRSNPNFWYRRNDGGFELKNGVRPSDAIRDIYRNGSKYGTECATAMQIVYYKALLDVLPEDTFNRTFQNIYLMNWHHLSPALQETGLMRKARDYLPGDRRYFNNPDVDPETPEWQGENVIDLGGGLYYGHGIGIHRADDIIAALNENRRRGAREGAYLMDQAGRPDFSELFALSQDAGGAPGRTRRSA
jgi:protein-glutamine gamma-glutamyltransferase